MTSIPTLTVKLESKWPWTKSLPHQEFNLTAKSTSGALTQTSTWLQSRPRPTIFKTIKQNLELCPFFYPNLTLAPTMTLIMTYNLDASHTPILTMKFIPLKVNATAWPKKLRKAQKYYVLTFSSMRVLSANVIVALITEFQCKLILAVAKTSTVHRITCKKHRWRYRVMPPAIPTSTTGGDGGSSTLRYLTNAE